MELGGLRTERERVFLLSTTHGAEIRLRWPRRVAPSRSTARTTSSSTLHRQGKRLREGVHPRVAEPGCRTIFTIDGRPATLLYAHPRSGQEALAAVPHAVPARAVRKGVLAPNFIISYSHSDADVDATIAAVAKSLVVYKKALEEGVEKYLTGRSIKPVYRRFN